MANKIADRFKLDLNLYERIRKFVLNYIDYKNDPITLFKKEQDTNLEPFIKGYTVLVFTTPLFSALQTSNKITGYSSGGFFSSIIHFFSNDKNAFKDYSKENEEVISTHITSNNVSNNTGLSFAEKITAGFSKEDLNELLKSPFLYSLNKHVQSITIPDIQISIESMMGNLQKERYMSPTFFSGMSGGTFSTSFVEDKYLSITKLLNLWYKYIQLVTTGELIPAPYIIANNIIDYKSSCYILSYDAVLKDLQFYAKFTGIMPTKLPLSPFSNEIKSHDKVIIDTEWSYDYFEYLDSNILTELDDMIKSGLENRT